MRSGDIDVWSHCPTSCTMLRKLSAARKSLIPLTLIARDGDELLDHYRQVLETRGAERGMPGLILGKAQNKF